MKVKWSELCIHTTNEAIEPISNILHENGASGVVIQDPYDLVRDHATTFGEIYDLNVKDYPKDGVYIKAYLPINSSLDETVKNIKHHIHSLIQYGIDLGNNKLSLNEVDDEDWATAWKKYYKPVKVSNKITITPTWEQYIPDSSKEIIIELDPGMAFGTGTHPTTILCIRSLERNIQENDTVIDVGCGSGVLSIASILLGAKEVFAYDLDDVAIKSTKLNAKINNIDSKIHPQINNLLDDVQMQADVIVSNILAEIIVQFVPDAYSNLKQGGLFITSGIIESKSKLVMDHLKTNGFKIVTTDEMDEWVSIVAKKL